MKTPKSVLFPSVVKALCNNTEIVKLINKYAQGASYDLVRRDRDGVCVRSYQRATRNRVVIPASITQVCLSRRTKDVSNSFKRVFLALLCRTPESMVIY